MLMGQTPFAQLLAVRALQHELESEEDTRQTLSGPSRVPVPYRRAVVCLGRTSPRPVCGLTL
jgi:hypothetical protein